MKPTQVLPPEYVSAGTLDLSKDRRTLILLNLLGLALLVMSGAGFAWAILRIRPDHPLADGFTFQAGLSETLLLIGGVLLLSVVNVLLHEGIHGAFFWWLTRARPLFAFRWTYAYAAAPDWFIPRNQYLLVGLAPLVLISLGGLLLAWIAPAGWLLPLWFILTSNASGAVGDLLVAAWLLRQPGDCLARDQGDAITLYNRKPQAGL